MGDHRPLTEEDLSLLDQFVHASYLSGEDPDDLPFSHEQALLIRRFAVSFSEGRDPSELVTMVGGTKVACAEAMAALTNSVARGMPITRDLLGQATYLLVILYRILQVGEMEIGAARRFMGQFDSR